MTFDQPHELIQGGIVYDSEVSPDTPWLFETMAQGMTLGHAPPLLELVQSLLTDGEFVKVVSHGNREVSFRLRVSATDGQALAQAEALLATEKLADRPSPLVWTPPSLEAWPCVFDVVHMDIEADFSDGWDIDERFRCYRYYLVTLTCLPWVRDPDVTTIEALAPPADPEVPAVYETISAISGTADWTPYPCHVAHFGTVFEDSGTDGADTWYRVYATNTYTNSIGFIAAQRVASTSLAGFPYLTVDVELSSLTAGGPAPYVRISATGVGFTAPIAQTSLGGSKVRYYFEGLPDTLPLLMVGGWWPVTTLLTTRRLKVYEIGRTDRIEVSGSNGFQLARTAVVGGSAPTQAAISFDAGVDPLLGSTALIYTGASPVIPLRNVLDTSATVTTDDTKISGGYNDLSSDMVFLVPVSRLSDSTYSLPVRLNSTGSDTIAWSAKVTDSVGADIPGSEVVVSGETLVVNDTADAWMIHCLAQIQLPVVKIEGDTTHAVELTLSMASGGAGVLVDEGWLCDTDNGDLTIIHEPSAFELTQIELRSPQLDALEQSVYGTWATHGTQNITRLATALGTHLLKPGLIHVFTATDLAKYAACSLEFFRRYLNYAGPDLPVDDA